MSEIPEHLELEMISAKSAQHMLVQTAEDAGWSLEEFLMLDNMKHHMTQRIKVVLAYFDQMHSEQPPD